MKNIEQHSMAIDEAHGFAAAAHLRQKRKYTGEPYHTHCFAVAALVRQHTDDPSVVVAAVLHDTIEDTEVTCDDLARLFGERVADLVLEVTNASRPEDGNRASRKGIDRLHLAGSSPEGATIKLADIIDNAGSIAAHDPTFARVYLEEKRAALEVLRHGNAELWKQAERTLSEARDRLAAF